jgi:pimeloyl-ACP methyl ester carboxylesterase
MAGEGDPVVLLHGWGAESAAFQPVQDFLSRSFRVYAPDLPGFGKSEEPREVWGIADYSSLVRAFILAMGHDSVLLVGHSFGGRIAVYLAAHHPELIRKMILVDAAGIIPKRTWRYYSRVYTFKALKKIYASPLFGPRPEERLEKLYRRFGSADYRNAGRMRQIMVRVVNEDMRPFLPKIQAPTLLIWGENDQDTPVYMGKIMEREIPDAGLVVLPNAGHYSYLDRFQDFCIISMKFLKSGDQR